LQRNGITPAAGIQLAKHSRGLSANLQVFETRNARFLNGIEDATSQRTKPQRCPKINSIGGLSTRQFAKLVIAGVLNARCVPRPGGFSFPKQQKLDQSATIFCRAE
jgi:hypothetical protein